MAPDATATTGSAKNNNFFIRAELKIDYAIKEYNNAAIYASQNNSHAAWKAVAYNFGAVICLLAYANSVDMQTVLNRVAAKHRPAFIHQYGENARNLFSSAILRRKRAVLCLKDNQLLLPQAIKHSIADFLTPQQDPELEEIRTRNYLKFLKTP